jgi:predicted GNAT family acetyltransferase
VKDPKIARELTEQHTAIYLERDSHRLLYEGDRPVSRTGINAQVGDVVQIGGVYTPPQLRGQGYARRAVAYHLDELRQKGVKEAVLFAASDKAAQAYRAIGCKPAGRFAVVVYDPPATLSQAIERGDC